VEGSEPAKELLRREIFVYSLRHFYAVNALRNGVGVVRGRSQHGDLSTDDSAVLRQASHVGRVCNKAGRLGRERTHKQALAQYRGSRRYSVFFEVRADLARVAGSMFGGGCCSPAIAHQTLT